MGNALVVLCWENAPVAAQGYNAVVITEIMADPTPVVGLPDAEYLEILNCTTQPINLKGWKLNKTPIPDSVLAPGSYAIVCVRSEAALLAPFGKVIGLSTFSLVNAGATLTLRNASGQLVHSVAYLDNWWAPDRRNGGYALEMIDPANPCGGADNWRVSSAPTGGTPGQHNAVASPNPDRRAPVAERVEIAEPNLLKVYFNERLDSVASIKNGRYTLKGRGILKSALESPAFNTLLLTLDAPLTTGERYEFTVSNNQDCAGNHLAETTFAFGIPVAADSGDVILNEILFDPRTDGVEFAEIRNTTPNFISLKNWSLGNVKDGKPGSFRTISANDLLLAPNGFMALSIDAEKLAIQYPTERDRTLMTVPSMPAFVNEVGGVALRDSRGRLMDLFVYQENDHSPLLTDTKGVSLERRDPDKPSNDPANWQSAAGIVGYATPGYANSQGLAGDRPDGFVVTPEAITPNGDGLDDFATIRYVLGAVGVVASVRIYDIQGRLVRDLIRNQTIGTDGSLRWDGTDNGGQLVRTGYYLLLIDTYDAAGSSQQFKKRVVVVTQ